MSTMTSKHGARPTTQYAVSADGTEIAYDVTGSGPALVIVEGALCQRAMGTAKALRDSLEKDYTVVAYDRRGRGQSGPGAGPFEVQREIEDLAAVITAAGGDAYVFGASSGAVLALEAARQGVPMRRLALYEAPFILDDTRAPNDPDIGDRFAELVASGDRSAAVKTFMRVVGAPAPMVALMPLFPVWKKLTAVAHTLPYDFALVGRYQQGEPLPEGHYAGVGIPSVVIAGGKSPAYLKNAQAAVAAQIPDAELVTLAGETHMVRAKATTPVLRAHFR